ncbi:MAG: LysM peptidoglycan-binding domain-containing protein [Woeseiaceae bacterium]
MHGVKQRLSSNFRLQTLAIAGVFGLVSAASADPAYEHLINSVPDTANIVDAGSMDSTDYLWLELDPLAAIVSVASGPDDDLLEMLRYGFSLDPVMNSRVQAELNWFVRNPNYLNRVFNRAQRYLPHIVDELEARDLPLELALLPIVESAFDPFAYSHGRAAGLWQMIPGTARRFGIEQNWWYDGRRDVVDSTRAALEYLEYLHKLQDGDWPNAIASYNSGEGNVLKAKRRNRANSRPTDFWNLKLSRETSAYVPRLMALVEIVRDPDQFGLTRPEIVDEPQFVVTDIEGQIDLALAAELAGIELDTLSSYNAGNNRWATDPDGPHRLIMPVDVAEDFATALAEVPLTERLRWQRHKVRNGEAISQIAENYNVTVATIRSANNLRGNTIRAGAYLMIPVATKPLTAYSQSSDERRNRKQATVRNGNRVEHVVASGESFWTISRKYDVDMIKLAAWNGTAPRDTLSIGQKLVVWTSQPVPTKATSSNNLTRKLNYTVRRGDSLYLIASRFRVSVAQLVRWNNIDKNKILRPGQRLTMYVDVTAQSS